MSRWGSEKNHCPFTKKNFNLLNKFPHSHSNVSWALNQLTLRSKYKMSKRVHGSKKSSQGLRNVFTWKLQKSKTLKTLNNRSFSNVNKTLPSAKKYPNWIRCFFTKNVSNQVRIVSEGSLCNRSNKYRCQRRSSITRIYRCIRLGT